MTPSDGVQALTLDVHLGPQDLAAALRADVLTGLTSRPKQLQPRWFYDETGCSLFDQITSLDEYYLTRREREILLNHADDIAVATGADTLVELGSGTSEKTRILLDAFAEAGTLERFVPFDIAEATLRSAAAAVATAPSCCRRSPGISTTESRCCSAVTSSRTPPGSRLPTTTCSA